MRERDGRMLEGADAAVPVPLHPTRRRARGFNQAEDLARHLAIPVSLALRRVVATTTQADLSGAERQTNVREAFGATRAARALAGKTVVLVDDVTTTGATMMSCAGVLLAAGVAEVRMIAAAKAVLRQS
jgi:ComF family protein